MSEHQAQHIVRIYWKSPQSKMMSATNTVFPPAVPFTDNELGFVSLQSSDLSLEQFNISLQLFKNKRGPVCSETCPRNYFIEVGMKDEDEIFASQGNNRSVDIE